MRIRRRAASTWACWPGWWCWPAWPPWPGWWPPSPSGWPGCGPGPRSTATGRRRSPGRTVTGRHSYTIGYRLTGVAPGGRLAWDAVGTSWTVPIGQVEVHVVAPLGLEEIVCVRGVAGSTTPCQASQPEPGHLVATLEGLDAGQGVTLYGTAGQRLAAAPALPVPPRPPSAPVVRGTPPPRRRLRRPRPPRPGQLRPAVRRRLEAGRQRAGRLAENQCPLGPGRRPPPGPGPGRRCPRRGGQAGRGRARATLAARGGPAWLVLVAAGGLLVAGGGGLVGGGRRHGRGPLPPARPRPGPRRLAVGDPAVLRRVGRGRVRGRGGRRHRRRRWRVLVRSDCGFARDID